MSRPSRVALGTIGVAIVLAGLSGTVAVAQTPPPAAQLETSTTSPETEDQRRRREQAAELEAVYERDDFGGNTRFESDQPGFVGAVAKMVMMLGAVVLLAYLLLGKLLPKLLALSPTARRNLATFAPQGVVEVVDRLPIDPKRAIYVVKVGGGYFLIGVGEQNLSLLARLDPDDLFAGGADAAANKAAGRGSGPFGRLLSKRTQKET